ncbi:MULTISPECIES: DICT sensory domain-containing protein [Haloarcula]|uniref:DICT sensory domain-containing protein n=1 Tax=Haloarcula TaxID=2237 RepID=UPI0023ED9FEC|nr:DICT sensory domain-containing protein [Halomicroarcula sp. XH51]
MTIARFIDAVSTGGKTLTVYNEDEPAPLVRMLRRMVDTPTVDVREGSSDDGAVTDAVTLEDENGAELGMSSLEDIARSVLMVNSDLYTTGTRPVDEVQTPEVLANLEETTFSVSGKQKMLLIQMSRHIESLALQHGDGTLHAGFQYLSRIDDERGTRRVYERLVERDVDVHLYGVPDSELSVSEDVAVYTSPTEELRRSWFVVHTGCPDPAKAALVAEETGDNEWRGCWTFDGEVTDAVTEYVENTYRS